MFTCTQILPNVYHLNFDKRVEMNKSLGRIQEFAENAKLCNQFFSTSRLKSYYKSLTGNGRFCYWKAILGCNIPSTAFRGFAEVFNCWTRREKEVMAVVSEFTQPYYIIATAVEDEKMGEAGALEHEIAHALYSTNATYRNIVDTVLENLPAELRVKVTERVQNIIGYAPHVVWDETHAYLATDSPVTLYFRLNIRDAEEQKVLWHTHLKLSALLKNFSKNPDGN